ncbi:MAG TPA: SMP-30/gluconolactonase/LRE family protein [Casimicrobiaceae bacterium]|nr:SMP-30/gluconolactonase/LRE family protein [Casimicrobiaceae bacterium]
MSGQRALLCLSRRAWLAVAIALTLPAFLFGCATPPKQPEAIRPVWPGPPLTARVQFVRSIASEDDLDRDTTFSDSLLEFLSGVKPLTHRIGQPTGIAVSDDGNRVYIADNLQNAVFVFDFLNKAFSKIEGIAQPVGVALDAEENIYVVAPPVKQVVKFDRTGKRLAAFTDPSFERPTGIAIDKENKRLYVVDTGTGKSTMNSVKIFDLDGKRTGQIDKDSAGKGGAFLYPTYAAVDAKGNLYVTDTFNGRIQQFDVNGKYVKTFGALGDAWGNFDKPKGVAVDNFGNLYVVDSGWSNVQIFNPSGQVLLFFGGRGTTPGFMGNPTSIAIDKRNRIYVGDYFNHRVEVYDLVNTTAEDSFLKPPSNNPPSKALAGKPGSPPDAGATPAPK